jgi:hypothetical protein
MMTGRVLGAQEGALECTCNDTAYKHDDEWTEARIKEEADKGIYGMLNEKRIHAPYSQAKWNTETEAGQRWPGQLKRGAW